MAHKLIGALLILTLGLHAQNSCKLSISGKVIDQHDGQALSFAEVTIASSAVGTVVDSSGYYRLANLCPGTYEIIVYHIGCEPVKRKVNLTQNLTKIDFYLEHHQELLEEIVLVEQNVHRDSKASTVLSSEDVKKVQELGIEALSEQIAGVNTLNSGNNVIKPIIHGMYGNRIITSVNGIALEDQQWGREHGLSVDLQSTDQIAVISGAAAVEYGSGALGGVLILSPSQITSDSVVTGQLKLQGQTNGRGGSAHLRLEQAINQTWNWRIQAGGSRLGDLQAPKYNLSNTGFAGLNYSLETGYKNKAWQGRVFFNATNRNLGVLRASSTGNISDLESAIESDEPLYIKDFTYNIAAPRQEVSHYLAGTEWKFRPNDHSFWELRYGFQNNRRREFDLRRGVSDEVPANNLKLITHSVDFKLRTENSPNWRSKYGISATTQINSNIPGTGIRPILPNYNRYRIGAFTFQEYEHVRWVLQAGLRYDFEYTLAQKFDRQNQLQKPDFQFHNISANLGATLRINYQLQISSDLALASRPPHTIELLSEGLHHGAASIEIGDTNLVPEQSLNWSNTLSYTLSKRIQIELTAFVNPVNNYIFQVADSVPRLTIRGAFPVWRYVQSDVLLTGLDFSTKIEFSKSWEYRLLGSLVRGFDLSNDEDLILMPPPRINQQLIWKISEVWAARLEYQWTGMQNHYPEDLDIAPPPPAYNLLNLGIDWEPSEKNFRWSLQIRNLTNAQYRMYLDRFRYYADRPGINFVLNFNYDF